MPLKLDCYVVSLVRYDGREFAGIYVGKRARQEANIKYRSWASDLKWEIRRKERTIRYVAMHHVTSGRVVQSEGDV